MRKETQKQIDAYKAMLPGLRERIIAVALLLVISIGMMATASYAWLTISTNPEVRGVSTTVTANGNLEIALVSPGGSRPGESNVGDSFASPGQNILASNITWGNLINLSDPSYGLGNIVLRPALLGDTNNLLNQPLKGADYGEDGRVELYYNEDFQFTNWVQNQGGEGYFMYNEVPQYGVRAISTVKYTYVNNDHYQYVQLLRAATNARDAVKTNYDKMLGNKTYIDALAALIGYYMTDKLNSSDTNVNKQIEAVYNLMMEFEGTVASFQDALVALANVQVFNHYGSKNYTPYTYTWDTLSNASAADLKANGVELTSLSAYRTIRNTIDSVLYGTNPDADDSIGDLYARVKKDSSASVPLSELLPHINKLVDIGSCEIVLKNGTVYKVSSIGRSAALELLGQKGVNAKITKGVLKDFETLSGCRMLATNVTVKATYIFTVSMTADTITTNAVEPYTFDKDVQRTEQVAAGNKGDYTAVAEDTYGMALDFWVRTNASSSYLVLEGNVLTKTDTVRETGTDLNGNTVELYTVVITTTFTNDAGEEESVSESLAVYQDQDQVWRNATTHEPIYDEEGNPPAGQSISSPLERFKEVVTVIGYEGENRVWQDNAMMDVNSTTQGSGSCYVFYADDPAQQENSLRLLSNLRVAFIDSNENSETYGKMVGLAKLNIENRYEENGKVTLPLMLMDDGSTYLTKLGDGLAILPLSKNTATRITAIVYLDGREMTNSDVLAANDIQGQLNIQFGSYQTITAVGDEDLEEATRSVSAVASATGTYPGSNSLIEFSYDENNKMTVHIKMAVNGEQPNNAVAFFMRKVNSTQGSREVPFVLTKGDDGYWYGSYTFTSPGEYVLRTVQLDGVDYDLPSDDYPQVRVKGFTIKSVALRYEAKEILEATTIMSGSNAISTSLSLTLASDQKLPGTVALQFVRDDGTQVLVNMSYNSISNTWTGTGSFNTSGEYTLKYAIMDGEYTELDPSYQRTLTVYVGITVQITDGGEKYHNTVWEGKPFTVDTYVKILDNTGAQIRYLSGAKLYYTRAGSNVDGMNPDLKWNSAEDCYTANLLISGPGIYTFNCVTLGNSTLKSTAGTVPKYTCISPEPPEYEDAQPMEDLDYELSTGNNSISMVVRLSNAEAATVIAVLRNADTGEEIEIQAPASNTITVLGKPVSEFWFELPKNKDGYQSGDWTIVELKLINVYDKDLNFYDETNPMTIDLRDSEDDLHVKVVNVKVTVSGENENLNGLFMETKPTTKPITIKITDQNGEKLLLDIGDLKLQYVLEIGSNLTYGGYSADHLTDQSGAGENDVYTLSGDGMTFTLNQVNLVYAGKYYANSMTFTVGDTSVPYSRTDLQALKMPEYTLTTEVPEVRFTATDPAAGSSFDGADTSNNGVTRTNSISADGYMATCFFRASANSCGNCGGFTASKVTTTVYNLGLNFTSATLTFASNGTGNDVVFTYTPNGTSNTQNVGRASGTTRYPIGLGAMATELMVTYNGNTFTFVLENALTLNGEA